jgi:hypothetical protein
MFSRRVFIKTGGIALSLGVGPKFLTRAALADTGSGMTLQIPFVTLRNDGFTGTTRAGGFLNFKPGEVTVDMLAMLTVHDDTDTEVPSYVEDYGARHVGSSSPDSVLGVYLEVEATFATLATTPSFTAQFSQTPLPRLVKQGPVNFSNVLAIGLSAAGTQLRITAPFTYYRYDSDTPTRVSAALDVPWDSLGTVLSAGASAQQQYWVRITVDGAGSFHARVEVGGGTAVAALAHATIFQTIPGLNGDEQVLGWVCIYVANGAASVTIGTTDLSNAAGVTVTTTAGTYKPKSVLPTAIPTASLTVADVSYLCACEFVPYPLTPSAAELALGGTIAAVETRRLNTVNTIWQRRGTASVMDAGGGTQYQYPLLAWLYFARTGQLRHYRRALAYETPIREYLDSYTSWGAGTAEQTGDIAGHLVYAALTGSTYELNKITPANNTGMLWMQERGQLVNLGSSNPQGTGSLRRAMHVIAGLNWFARLGFAPGAGYSLALPSDGTGWTDAASYVTVTTPAQHFARMMSRLATYMIGPDGAGLYHIRMDDYTDFGPFMFGFLASAMVQGFAIFGTPAGGHDIVERTYEYMFTAEQSPGVRLIYPSNLTAGFESFVYSTPIGATVPSPTAPELNGPHMLALGYLLRATLEPKWRLRGDVLYAALRNADPVPYFHKALAETSLHALGWLPDRMTPIPGVTGVLALATLNLPASLLRFVSGSTSTLQLSIASTLDAFGDPVSQTGMSVAWSSLNTAVATVDSTGLVTTVASGTATIRAAVTIAGATVNADCALTVSSYLQYADFSSSAGWTLAQSGGTTVNSVTGGELVQTMQNVSVARADETVSRDCTGRTFMARIAQLAGNTSQEKARAIILDAAGKGLFMMIDTGTLYWGTVTGGYGANPSFTTVGAGNAVTATGAFHFKFVHNSGTDQWTLSYSVSGTTYTTKASAQSVLIDETTARWCLRTHIAANGTAVNTTRWDSVNIF